MDPKVKYHQKILLGCTEMSALFSERLVGQLGMLFQWRLTRLVSNRSVNYRGLVLSNGQTL